MTLLVSDGGWGASCYQAMVNAAKDSGWETVYTDNVATADFCHGYDRLRRTGLQPDLCARQSVYRCSKAGSRRISDIKFALLNGTVETENITSILPDAKQIGYMAGALAGLMSKTNNIDLSRHGIRYHKGKAGML